MKHIFLSYSRQDTDVMQRLKAALQAKGVRVWVDEKLTPGTRDWKAAIETAIESAGAIVVILSPAAKASEWVDRELEYARMRNITIFPLLVRGDAVSAVPFELVSSQWMDMRSEEKFLQGVEKLIPAIKNLLLEKEKTKQKQLHQELVLLADKLPGVMWIGVFSVDGLTVAFHAKNTTRNAEEDRVSAMSAATLALSERIAGELNLGDLEFSIIGGNAGLMLEVALDLEAVIIIGLGHLLSIDRLFIDLNEAWQPLLKVMEVKNIPDLP